MSQSKPAVFPYPGTSERLEAHAKRLLTERIDALLNADPDRCSDFSQQAAGLKLDYSRHLLDDAAREELVQLALGSQFGQGLASYQLHEFAAKGS